MTTDGQPPAGPPEGTPGGPAPLRAVAGEGSTAGGAAVRPFAMNEARFAVPAGWLDQTVHILAANPGADGAAEFSVVIHRDAPQAGEALAAFVERQLANAKATLPGFRLLREGATAVGGAAARDAEFRWTADAGLLHQRQVYLLRQGRVLTVTATAPERFWAKHAPAFDALLASWQFQLTLVDPRRVAGAAPGAPPEA